MRYNQESLRPNLHNVLSAVAVISIGLIVLWVVFFKEQSSQSKE